MDISRYRRSLSSLIETGGSMRCQYCGVGTQCAGTIGICSNCENIIAARSPVDQRLDAFNGELRNRNYDGALLIYQEMAKEGNSPPYTYVDGLTHIKYSNHENSLIDYGLDGFMEENAVHREKSIALYSKARLLFSKALAQAKSMSASGEHNLMPTDYIMLLCDLKLGDIRSAKSRLERLPLYNDSYVLAYANIMFNSAIGDCRKTLESCSAMIGSGRFPIGIFYYVAIALLKDRQYSTAKRLAAQLSSAMPDNLNLEYIFGAQRGRTGFQPAVKPPTP